MSFRSRSRTTQPIVRRRSLSGSRVPSTISTTNSYLNSSPQSYVPNRPISIGLGYSPSSYSSSTNHYGSRENLYSPTKRTSFFSSSPTTNRRDIFSTSTYKSPYADRYVSPYSSYDNGVITAGLNLSSYSTGSSYKNNSYTKPNSSVTNGSYKEYKVPPRNTNLMSTGRFSSSNTSLNSYSTTPTTSAAAVASTIGRSQSFKEPERPKRRNRNNAKLTRSCSISSEKSEGYESGSEKSSRSRLGSTSSLTSEASPDSKSSTENSTENGEHIDYKALYEAARLDNEKLRLQLKKKEEDLVNAKAAVDRFANATTKNSLSELEKRERRALERKLSEMEEELKQLQKYKTENERLRAENRALTRVVSKLTTSAQNQLHNKPITMF